MSTEISVASRLSLRISARRAAEARPKRWKWRTASSIRGHVIYDGPSAYTGERILGIVTYKSDNRKNKRFCQLWILVADKSPIEASRTWADESICGTCPHRRRRFGSSWVRTCYVDLGKGPAAVWKAWQRGRYDYATIHEIAGFLRGRKLRFGAYGDPAMLPHDLLYSLKDMAESHTGYTRQWEHGFGYQDLLMASVANDAEAAIAQSMGYRTFQVTAGLRPRKSGVAQCPASAEMGRRRTCDTCGMCDGVNPGGPTANIEIPAHGPSGRRAAALRIVE